MTSRMAGAFQLAVPLRAIGSSFLRRNVNPRRFATACTEVKYDRSSTKPKFPGPVIVSSIPPIPAADLDAFCAEHISYEKLDGNSPEGQARFLDVPGLQYKRWRWAVENIETYVNMLRAAGHADSKIQHMFDGTPMCFPSPAAYAELRSALSSFAKDIEAEMNWKSVGYVVTGSSVVGFSQNPLKGFAETPSKITKTATSDVDICIVGEGVNKTMRDRLQRGELEPRKSFPTTCSPDISGIRFGCYDMSAVCQAAHRFHKVWSEKLPAGLQFTFSEAGNATPPWEAFIDIDNV